VSMSCSRAFFALVVFATAALPVWSDDPCAQCHAKEVAGFSATAMAHSLSSPIPQTSGTFLHAVSNSRFTIRSDGDRTIQHLERHGAGADYRVAYIIGSGTHAFGYLVQVGDHLFQSPISYYTKRGIWDMAPGYEEDRRPDFDRPITAECLFCHAGRAKPIRGTLNRYETPPFQDKAITCERCHGPAEAHLRNPVPHSIVNPQKLSPRARDSVCEQCHLSGEARVLNPGKQFSDFQAGQELEDVFSVYVSDASPDSLHAKPLKVISHVQQLALSRCARESQGKMWCGTCHDPHEQPADPKTYFRARCLACHGSALASSHAVHNASPTCCTLNWHPKPGGDDCIGCHMPRRPAKDGGHTAFTDHRITRFPQPETDTDQPETLIAWHEPQTALAKRNLGLAYIEAGRNLQSAKYMLQGYRLLVACEPQFPNDPAVLTGRGLVLLGTGRPAQAAGIFERAVRVEPNVASHYVDEGFAWERAQDQAKAIENLERALQIDPMLKPAYQKLAAIYLEERERAKIRQTFERYLKAFPGSIEAQVALHTIGLVSR
jgi:cytochrome c554/c'-like protein